MRQRSGGPMNARAIDHDRFLDGLRKQVCQPKPGGGWLCQCFGELPEGATICGECQIKADQREAARRKAEWLHSVKSRCHNSFAAIPDWNHTKSAEAFAKVISDKSLRTVAERWIPTNGSLLLLGSSGLGKTSAINRALRRLEAERVDALLKEPSAEADQALSVLARTVWVTACDLARALGPYGTDLEALPITRAVEASLLVIDELGPEPPKHSGFLFDVVDRRYARQLPTVVTSGLTFGDLRARYGDALPRRLYDKGVGRLIDLHKERNAK